MLLIYVSVIKSILLLFIPFVVTPPAKTIYSSIPLLTNNAVALLLGYNKVPVILVIVVLSVDNYTTSIISVY